MKESKMEEARKGWEAKRSVFMDDHYKLIFAKNATHINGKLEKIPLVNDLWLSTQLPARYPL